MILNLIAEGSSRSLNRLGDTIQGIGKDIQTNRLLQLERTRQAEIDKRTALENRREDFDDRMKFEAGAIAQIRNIKDDSRLLPAYMRARQQAHL